jgi:hypothetical protein
MAQTRANREGVDQPSREQYLESYQRLVASWIEAIVDKQSKATLAEFNATNQHKPSSKPLTGTLTVEGL